MTSQVLQIRWGRVALTGIAVYALSFILILLVVTVYASSLAVQARGAAALPG